MKCERDGLTLIVHAPNEAAARNLELYLYFWPDNDPPPPSRARVAEVDAAVMRVKEVPKCD